jgi:hypothetical protein
MNAETAHFAHVRYAAAENSGTVYYDPRDNRERYTRDVADSELSHREQTITTVVIKPWRPAQFGEAAEQYTVEIYTATLDRRCGEDFRTQYSKSKKFESVEEAREYAAENVPGYSDAPRKNALKARGVVEGGAE